MKHALTAMAVVFALLLVIGIPITPSGAATASVRPPSSINDTCGSDVSRAMTAWLTSLPTGTTVNARDDCFLVNEGMSLTLNNITISGGTWKDDTPPAANVPYEDINAVFWLVRGSNVTLEHLSIQGVNGAPYNEGVAFQAGIRSDGVQGLVIRNVDVRGVGGDGVTFSASDDPPYSPTTNAVVSDVNITDVGRQGITLSDIDGAKISNVVLTDIGLDTFDMEADAYGEVAQKVAIDGCTANGAGGDFFGNGGQAGGSPYTTDIVVEHCTMEQAQTGTAIYVDTPAGYGVRGPFIFAYDTLACGSSAYVGCVELTGGNVDIVSSSMTFPTYAEPQYRRVYDVYGHSRATFLNDAVGGYSAGTEGGNDGTGTTKITGGTWKPWPFSVAAGAPSGSGYHPTDHSSPPVHPEQPAVSTPETPFAIVLPIVAVLAIGGTILFRQRRKRSVLPRGSRRP